VEYKSTVTSHSVWFGLVIGDEFSEQLMKYKHQYKQFRPLLNYGKERLLNRGIAIEIPDLPQVRSKIHLMALSRPLTTERIENETFDIMN
jgi:hypothetical protein